MPYIYKIENMVNQKVYIGQTSTSIELRFKEHIKNSKNNNLVCRPLYNAMRKYGVENFKISIVEECLEENLQEREIFWIEQFGSFKSGYNATLGGEGRKYLDYDLLIKTYLITQNLTETSKICNVDRKYLSDVLKSNDILILSSQEVIVNKQGNEIAQIDILTNTIIATYSSARKAAESLKIKNNNPTHIMEVCKNKRQTAYGYKWKFLNNMILT